MIAKPSRISGTASKSTTQSSISSPVSGVLFRVSSIWKRPENTK